MLLPCSCQSCSFLLCFTPSVHSGGCFSLGRLNHTAILSSHVCPCDYAVRCSGSDACVKHSTQWSSKCCQAFGPRSFPTFCGRQKKGPQICPCPDRSGSVGYLTLVSVSLIGQLTGGLWMWVWFPPQWERGAESPEVQTWLPGSTLPWGE